MKDSQDAYNDVCSSTSPENKAAWLEVEAKAQRDRWDDKTAMNVYDVQADKGNHYNISLQLVVLIPL